MDSYVKQPQEYLALLWREKALVLAVAAALTVAGFALALALPPAYRATATVLIESAEVPSEFVQTTVTSFADQRLQVINQRVMTTQNLVEIMDRYGLYAEARRTTPLSTVVEGFRNDIELETVSARVVDPRSGRPVTATIAFTVSYDSREPRVAQQVANELVSLYLSKNIEERQEAASQTTAFLAQEADRLSARINELESKLADFKQEHAGRLPGQLGVNQQSLERAEQELVRIELRRDVLNERQIFLETQLTELERQASLAGPDVAADPPAAQLAALRAQFTRLKGAYGPQHPDVARLRREIGALEQVVDGADDNPALLTELAAAQAELGRLRELYGVEHPDVERAARTVARLEAEVSATANEAPDGGSDEAASSPASLQVQAQLKVLDMELGGLARERQDLRARIEAYSRRLLETPEVERAYQTLIRDYENTQARYKDIKDKQIAAEMAEALESELKAERFSLIEPPQLPAEPVRPNRKAIAGGALAIGLMSGFGLVLLRDAFDDRIHGARQLAWLAGAPPLVVVPYIRTRHDRLRSLWLNALWTLVIGASLFLGLVAVDTYVRPLDIVWLVVLRKLGLG